MARTQEIRTRKRCSKHSLLEMDARCPPTSPNIGVLNHVWVDKKSNGVAKSRFTCADVKQKQTPEQRLISQGQSNFCPTPHPVSLKILEAYALLHKYPRAKTDLTSSFLIARDSGDDQGQSTCLKPPQERLNEYEVWLAVQDQKVQPELANVRKQHILWQVDGNIYGRQPAAAAYRQELENIPLNKLDPAKHQFQCGRIGACV